ncbi:MAG: hypothetical protein CO079_09140, partial [Nitrosopumilales archaeon CG_4_9_14_0_8_um_filter_34_10]
KIGLSNEYGLSGWKNSWISLECCGGTNIESVSQYAWVELCLSKIISAIPSIRRNPDVMEFAIIVAVQC